jgi:hypothetical protein
MFFVFAFIFTALFSGCNTEAGDYKTFAYDIRGTWINLDTIYHDKLEISVDRITITPDDYYFPSDVPGLKGFTPRTAIEGYSEKAGGYSDRGSLFIKDRGDWQNPVPYKRWGDYSDPRLTIGDDSDPTDKSKYTTFKKQP